MIGWMLGEPDKLTFDSLDRVVVKLVAGAVSVVGGDDRPTLEVSELDGPPLRVRQEGGTLTIDYERPGRRGPLAWLSSMSQRRHAVLSLAVPRDCRVDLRVVSASLMVGGLRAPVVARSVSGEITLAGLGGTAAPPTPKRSRAPCRPPASPGTCRPTPCPATSPWPRAAAARCAPGPSRGR
jgi:hypothetical protein